MRLGFQSKTKRTLSFVPVSVQKPRINGVLLVSPHDLRKKAATLARSFLEGRITYEQFIDGLDENEDEDVTELEDLVEHMPARGGCFGSLFGWSDKDLARYRAEIEAVIRKLEST
jgi:hypothetical protein